MDRVAEEGLARGGERARRIERPQAREELLTGRHCHRGGLGEEPQLRHVRDPQCPGGEQQLRQIQPRDLRKIEGPARLEVVRRVEPNRQACARSAGPPGALDRRGLADLSEPQGGKAGPVRVAGQLGEPGVDHDADPVDGDRGLGHVGGEDHLAPGRGRHHAGLGLERQLAVQRKDVDPEPGRAHAWPSGGAQGLVAPANLGRARQEHQQIALGPVPQEPAHRGRHLLGERAIVRVAEVLDRDLEAASLAAHPRTVVEELGDGLGVEGGRHDAHPEVGAARAPQAGQQRQHQIARQVALVKLVEHHRPDAPERGIGEQPPDQDPLGDEADPGARRGPVLEADGVADGRAERLPELARDPLGGEPRREATWLEHPQLVGGRRARLPQRPWDPRGLPGPRRGFHDARAAVRDRRHDVGELRVYRQGVHADGGRRRAARPRRGLAGGLRGDSGPAAAENG